MYNRLKSCPVHFMIETMIAPAAKNDVIGNAGTYLIP